jgi:hypothetical protein
VKTSPLLQGKPRPAVEIARYHFNRIPRMLDDFIDRRNTIV